MVGILGNEETLRNFLVDRMRTVSILDQSFKKEGIDLNEYVKSIFNMYNGKDYSIKLVFDKGLINVVNDRFGLGAEIEPVYDEHFILRTNAIISEGLKRCLLTWRSDCKVIYPQELVIEMEDENG